MTGKKRIIEDLFQENKRLKEELKRERLEKEKIIHEKEKIVKEFEEFKAKHSQTVSKLKQALNIKADKRKAHKKCGAVKGHKSYTRRIPERVDKIKALNPKKCPVCNKKIEGKVQETRYRYLTDIKLTFKVTTTKYEIYRKYCKNCKKIVELSVPNALPRAKYGLNIMLLIMYLRLGLRIPGNKVSEYFLTLYNLSIGEGEIAHILSQLQREFGQYYKHLQKLVKVVRVKHTDSTGWRVNGKAYPVSPN